MKVEGPGFSCVTARKDLHGSRGAACANENLCWSGVAGFLL